MAGSPAASVLPSEGELEEAPRYKYRVVNDVVGRAAGEVLKILKEYKNSIQG